MNTYVLFALIVLLWIVSSYDWWRIKTLERRINELEDAFSRRWEI